MRFLIVASLLIINYLQQIQHFLICTNEGIEVDNAYKKKGVNSLKALISRIKMR